MRLIFMAVSIGLLGACQPAAPPAPPSDPPALEAPEPLAVPKLELLWTTPGFAAPEGAAKAPDGGLFISNVDGDASAKDGRGFISKVSMNGKIEKLEWATGLHAPKGMAVKDGVLYVADIDRIVTFDAVSGAKQAEIPVEGSKFLNDMTVWQGDVLVSDSSERTIHKIADGQSSLIVADSAYGGINGLLEDSSGGLLVALMQSGELHMFGGEGDDEVLGRGLKNADGIGLVPGGGWLVSSWPGQIHYVSPDAKVTTLIDTETEGNLQNDLTVLGDTVIVPNMLPGTVTAWRISR